MSRAFRAVSLETLASRRTTVLLMLSGIFIGAMAMLNILGITKFIHFGPLELAVGVLPYPLTFLCTDFISEFYGRRRANQVVLIGLAVNVMVLCFVWAGDAAEPIEFRTATQRIVTMDYVESVDAEGKPRVDPATGTTVIRPARRAENGSLEPVGRVDLRDVDGVAQLVDLDTGTPLVREETLFDRLAFSTQQTMLASMIAYLAAQFVDVWLFHFWKRLTKGKHLWLRNNGSTIVSQLVDTVCVVFITFWIPITRGEVSTEQVLSWIGGGYAFKFVAAALDTIPFYFGVAWLTRYLDIDTTKTNF